MITCSNRMYNQLSCVECLYHEALNKGKVWTDALELERLAYYSFVYSEEEYEHLRILRFARKHDMQIQVREDDGNDHQEYTAEQTASAHRKEGDETDEEGEEASKEKPQQQITAHACGVSSFLLVLV